MIYTPVFNRIFLVALLSLFSFSSFAGGLVFGGDDDKDKPAKLIINAGMTNATFDASEYKIKSDWMVGIQRDVKMFPSLRFNAALFYNEIGTRIPDAPNVHLGYFQLPAGLKVKLGPVYALGGASMAYKVFAEQADVNLKDEVKSVDFAAHLGFGFKILIFSIEGRYNWGLTDINKGFDPRGSEIHNRYFQLMLGVGLP